jgi:uncharacterized protein involved in exopolysaccharide biosynthesis
VQQDDIILDGAQLTRAFHRQFRLWILLGPVFFGGLLLAALCLVPRSYTAMISVALQQPSGGGSALAALAGVGGGASKRYIGLLKSRELAQSVERHVGLFQLYRGRFLTEEDAAEYLMKGIKPDDNAADGLLYVSVTLPGSPKLSWSHNPRDTQVKEAAAQAANAYALALKEYYLTSDTDQGAALLRGADTQVHQARADYNQALNDVLHFSRGLNRVDPRSAPASPNDSAGGPAVSGLGSLYSALAQVEADLRGAQASRQTRDTLTAQQIRDLANIPTDDPLLSEARSRVTQDQAAYAAATRLYGPENPLVIRAQTNLEVDKAALSHQIQGVQSRLTTPNIRSDEQIQGLYARQKVLIGQIASAERRLGIHRELSGQFGRLQQEVAFQSEVLKETLTEAAKIRLDNVSAKNRMVIVDSALPPKSGEPGVLKLALGCLALVLLAFGVAVARDYLRLAAAARASFAPVEEAQEALPV